MTAKGKAGERNVLNQSFFQPCVPLPMSKIDACVRSGSLFQSSLGNRCLPYLFWKQGQLPFEKRKKIMPILLREQPDKAPAHSKRNSDPGLSARGDSRLHPSSPKREHSPPATRTTPPAELENVPGWGKSSWDLTESKHKQHKFL